MSGKPPDLMEYIKDAVLRNRLIFIIVTSAAKGMIDNQGYFYGQGKSILALGLSDVIWKIMHPDKTQAEIDELVKENTGYFAEDFMGMVKRGMDKGRIACYIADDMEEDYGKHRSYDNALRKLAYFAETIRPYCAVFIGTAPDLGRIALCWREVFMFEIKVPFRGYCEIQKIKRWSDFKDPTNPRARLEYHGEQEFPMARPEMANWYSAWRDEQVRAIHKDIMDEFYADDEEPPMSEDEKSAAGKAWSRVGVEARQRKAQKLKDYEERDRILGEAPP